MHNAPRTGSSKIFDPNHYGLLPFLLGQNPKSDLQEAKMSYPPQADTTSSLTRDSPTRWDYTPTKGYFQRCLQSPISLPASLQN